MSKHYKVALSLAFVLCLLSLLFYFRQTLVIKLANHYILPPSSKLNCLEFTLNWQLDVAIEKVCLASDSFTLLGSKLHWQRQENSLSAQHIGIKLLPSEQSSQTTMPLALPENLPLINIHTLEISSVHLKRPLTLKVEQVDRRQFTLSANWQASIGLTEGQLIGDIQWTLADVLALGLDVDLPSLTPEQMHSPIASHFSFDGDQLVSDHAVDFTHTLTTKDCKLELSAAGKANISGSLSNKVASVDLSQMELELAAADCTLLQQVPAELRSTKFALELSEALALSADNIKASSVILRSHNGPSSELQINQLNYDFSGQGQANFQLNIAQRDRLTLQSVGQLALVNSELELTSKNQLSVNKWTTAGLAVESLNSEFELSYLANTLQLAGQASASHLHIEGQQVEMDSLSSHFTVKHEATSGLSIEGLANVKQLTRLDMSAVELSSKFDLRGAELALLEIELDNSIATLKQDSNLISNVANQMHLTLENQNVLTGDGHSQVAKLNIMGLTLAELSAAHSFKLDLAGQQLNSQHNVNLSKHFALDVSTNNTLADIEVTEQAISALAPLSNVFYPQLTLLAGTLSASIHARLDTLSAQGKISLNDVGARYDDIDITKLNYAPTFAFDSAAIDSTTVDSAVFDSASLQLHPTKLRIESVNAGVLLENVTASIEGSLAELVANNISVQVFAGQAGIEQFYLDGRDQQFELVVNNLDMAKLVELEKQSGIEVSGHLAGTLPMTLKQGAISVEQGRLYNQHDGQLRITNNAAFEAIKAQQPSLSDSLSLLEHVNFEKLESEINMDQDGQLKMNIAIVGFNPLAQETLNFNYGHDENVLVLLRALRLTDSLSKKIEQDIKNH